MKTELMTALAEAAYWRWRYSECAPDVGMGPHLETLTKEVIDTVGVHASQIEFEQIIFLTRFRVQKSL